MSSEVQPSDVLASIPLTVVMFGIVSFVLYICVLRPLLAPPPPLHQRDPAAPRQARRQTQEQRGGQLAASTASPQTGESDSGILTLLTNHTRLPPHMAPSSARHLDRGGIALLSDGLLPFRHGRAAAYEQSLDAETIAQNRKERARILAKILALDGSSSMPTPPARGSTIVVSIPSQDVGCSDLRRILYLLSTFFNAFVILNVPTPKTDDELDQMVAKLRGDGKTDLPSDVLPRHRIIASQSITGRIAFVRQLSRVEFVLDFDEEVRGQLSRFGFRVFVYGKEAKSQKGSMLGNELLA